jgi:PAT family beta-lactamase induction signal transducer AmpG
MIKKNALKKILTRKMLAILLLSVASGVPLGVVLTVLQAWMTKVGIDLKTIGMASLVQMPYTLKFVWAPLMDRFVPPFLGRRRGWMLITQIMMFIGIFFLGQFDPLKELTIVLAFATFISFAGASHDIVIDAYKREILEDDELGFGVAVANNSYLIGFRYVAVVLGLYLGDVLPWNQNFMILSCFAGLGILGTLIAPSPKVEVKPPKSVKDAVILPFMEFLKRSGSVEVLLFILLYKLGDNLAQNLMTPFYIKSGFTLKEVALVGKMVGFWATFLGTFIGGYVMFRKNLTFCLLWFGVLQALSTLAFTSLSLFPPTLTLLGVVVGFENLTAGMGTAAYAAFMMKMSSKKFSATQLALLTSFMGIPRTVIPSIAGYIVEPLGWTNFFIIATLCAIPGILMVIFRSRKWEAA